MVRLRKKLQSERGASILLALLMLLLCMLVAASILASAASNAGKARSNRVEQQKYLTLSSAIQLVADELEKATYTWSYSVYEWEKDEGTPEAPDWKYYFLCKQDTGSYECGDLTNLLPLLPSLEGELSKQFPAADGYVPLTAPDATEANTTTCTLLVSLPDSLSGYPYIADASNPKTYEISKDVAVRVVLDHTTHHITLTAWIWNKGVAPAASDVPPTDGSDTMIAELVAKEGTAPLLTYNNPEGRDAGASPPGTATKTETATMQWELHWIKKGAA